MARPKSNEKVIKFIEDGLENIEKKIDTAVLLQEFKKAVILKEWKDCMLAVLHMLRGEVKNKNTEVDSGEINIVKTF